MSVTRLGETTMSDPQITQENLWRCPRCKMTSGNDWSQCEKRCPIPVSPHYDERLAAAMDFPVPHQVIHV